MCPQVNGHLLTHFAMRDYGEHKNGKSLPLPYGNEIRQDNVHVSLPCSCARLKALLSCGGVSKPGRYGTALIATIGAAYSDSRRSADSPPLPAFTSGKQAIYVQHINIPMVVVSVLHPISISRLS